MKYKVGDYLRVRPDLKLNHWYYNEDRMTDNVVVGDMIDLRGKVVQVLCYDGDQYRLFESSARWTDDMFEGYAFPEEDIDADADQLLGLLM